MFVKHSVKFLATLLLVFGLKIGLQAQKATSISDADKKAILKIFEGVDQSQYKLAFNGGKEVHGTKAIKLGDIKETGRTLSPTMKQGFTFVVYDRSANEVVYVYSEGLDKMTSLLGQKKLKALQDIAARYQ